jgi:hypothetical protein
MMTTEDTTAPKDEEDVKESDEDIQDDKALLKEALERYDAAYERDRENILEGYEDLRFLAGENQWEEKAKAIRDEEGRPCLTINSLPTYVRQITGDIRQMRPSIKCLPADDDADPKTAEALANVIRYIENRSKAQTAVYAKAADSQVTSGIGHWRIRAEYSSPLTFNQDLKLEAIGDGVSVLWDPDAEELSRVDAKFCFVPVDMSVAGFKARYPGKKAEDFGSEDYASKSGTWATDNHIRVAEYWYKKPVKHKLVLLQDGSVYDLSDSNPKRAAEAAAIVEEARGAGLIEKEEDRNVDEVWRCVVSCAEVLEGPERHPGRFIPIVPVIGSEITIGRRVIRFGAIRFARDPQRMYNYSRSAQTEVVALQPKAPFIGTEKNFEEHQDIWETANTVNHPYLPYTPDSENGNLPPQRVQPAVSSTGLSQEIALAADDIQRTIGIYNASLGAQSNETSGKAINARDRQGDTGSFVYIDNFTYAVQHTGTILVDLIPHIYDTARTLRISGEDGKTEEVKINKPMGVALDDVPEAVENDLTVGSYDVVMAMGPSYSTRREEAREGMREFMQASPDAVPVIGDLYVKAQDWPMADEMAKRLRLMAPPQIQEAIAQEGNEPPPPPPPPNPAQEQAQQLEMQAAQMEVHGKELDLRTKDANARKAEADAAKAEFEAQAAMIAPMMPEAPPAPGSAPPQPEPDGRVDTIEQAMMGMQETLQAIIEAIQPILQPQEPPPMEPPPMGMPMEMMPQEPSPEGFLMDPNMMGEQPPV